MLYRHIIERYFRAERERSETGCSKIQKERGQGRKKLMKKENKYLPEGLPRIPS